MPEESFFQGFHFDRLMPAGANRDLGVALTWITYQVTLVDIIITNPDDLINFYHVLLTFFSFSLFLGRLSGDSVPILRYTCAVWKHVFSVRAQIRVYDVSMGQMLYAIFHVKRTETFLFKWPSNGICTLATKSLLCKYWNINTSRPRQNGRHFADDIFKCIFLNENVSISIKISLKFVPKGPINNIPALVQIMAWRRPGDKPLSEPMVVNLPTHICVTRPQWVNIIISLNKIWLFGMSPLISRRPSNAFIWVNNFDIIS